MHIYIHLIGAPLLLTDMSHSTALYSSPPALECMCACGVRVRPQTIFHPFYGCPVNVGKVNWLFKALVLRAAVAAVLTVIIKHNPTTSCRLSLMQRNTQTIGRQIGSPLRMQPRAESTTTYTLQRAPKTHHSLEKITQSFYTYTFNTKVGHCKLL
jgi:hypothetical protein